MSKGPDAFRTISEVAEDLDVPQHVLRFWETRFTPIRPLKRGGGRRYYRPDDVELLKGIRQLLYGRGYTIRGVQRILKEDGPRFVQAVGRGEEALAPRRETSPDEDGTDEREGSVAGEPEPGGLDEPDTLSFLTGSPQRGAVSDDTVARLRSALDDLLECERVLTGLKVR